MVLLLSQPARNVREKEAGTHGRDAEKRGGHEADVCGAGQGEGGGAQRGRKRGEWKCISIFRILLYAYTKVLVFCRVIVGSVSVYGERQDYYFFLLPSVV